MANFLTPFKRALLLFGITDFSYADSLTLSNSTSLSAVKVVDHGVYGELFSIDEEDMIAVLMRRLGALKESGKLEEFQKEFQAKAKKSVLEPKAVSHITATTNTRVFFVDPTLVIEGDIHLPNSVSSEGHVLARKGDRVNPLHTLKLSKGLLFIDGDDKAQQQLAVHMAAQFDIVLVKGKPIELEEALNLPIFFDQGGVLTKRYGIRHVPAKLEVDLENKADRLKITEFKA